MSEKQRIPLDDVTLEGEVWKPIADFPKYLVSNYGRVYSISSHKLIAISKVIRSSPRPYYAVRLEKNKKQKSFYVHRLVAAAFCENDMPEEKTVVDHIDNDPLNNMSSNLRWVTPWDNIKSARNDEIQIYTRWLIRRMGTEEKRERAHREYREYLEAKKNS